MAHCVGRSKLGVTLTRASFGPTQTVHVVRVWEILYYFILYVHT
jgi:hypothetical protein